MTAAVRPRATEVGVAVSTIGRPALLELLASLASSDVLPAAVVVADQSPNGLGLDVHGYPFPLTVVASTGGASRGRNDAVAALPASVRVIAFPNDDTTYPPETLGLLAERFATCAAAAHVCRGASGLTLIDELPAAGTALDRTTVWRAIEWTTVVSRAAFDAVGGFDVSLGTGCATPWQSGEGTDLLLTLIEDAQRVVSAADIFVHGAGERRTLTASQYAAKHRRYARGMGYVYRLHRYPAATKLKILLGPWLRLHRYGSGPVGALRIATARFVGRVEGLTGRTLG